ncbi:eIF-2-alpha kinase activator GCN1 isoform X2 (plasmid) [Acetobacter orientalis]|uniref:eIF-2-alpha kinase activator GCN1 isoform X2 n=1 Tax=Acetobacter orientalis TaxID=146474 RepID=A0A2Z5ZMK4_9PROT|nr:eIF-2-alpha kinase activator GCN1 isoform X2 [Acetobacter orientalis]
MRKRTTHLTISFSNLSNYFILFDARWKRLTLPFDYFARSEPDIPLPPLICLSAQ